MASPAFSAALDPITGYEDLRDLTHPRHALTQFYRAFNTQDIILMRQNWSPFEDTSMNNPIGGIKRGWPEIRQVYERLFAGPARVTVEFYNYSLHVSGDTFYAVGRERGRFENDATVFNLEFRTTRIYRLLDRHWRQVHHHGSIEDAALLDRYQSAINSFSCDPFAGHTRPQLCS
ncbi:MAG: nuclear transport factor 2 family protein [Candidatus Acidiferrum sp.]